MTMRQKWGSHARAIGLVLIWALALGGCAGPLAAPTALPATATAAPPTQLPTEPATSSAFPTVAAAVPATSIQLPSPSGVEFDTSGNLFVSHCGEDVTWYVSKIDSFELLTLYAGGAGRGFAGDGGPARAASMFCAMGIRFDRSGSLYVADFYNNRIRRIDQHGIISTAAGIGPALGLPGSFTGDGGPALSAQLNRPSNIAFDNEGNLYIADTNNNRIRKVDQNGLITTFAGNGTAGFSGDGGPALAAQLSLNNSDAFVYIGMAIDNDGNLYIADNKNSRIRKIDRQGIITTIAGNGVQGVSGDGGPARQ